MKSEKQINEKLEEVEPRVETHTGASLQYWEGWQDGLEWVLREGEE